MSGELSVKILTFNRPIFCFLLFCLLSFGAFTAVASNTHAQESAKAENDRIENYPLNITSEKMIALKNESMVEFIGNVKATQRDSVLTADSIKVYFDEGSDPLKSRGSIKKIVASGHVVYVSEGRKAYADQAVYNASDQTLILTGKSTRLVTGNSFVAGKKITLFRADDRVVVESDGKKRVSARFDPEDTPKE